MRSVATDGLHPNAFTGIPLDLVSSRSAPFGTMKSSGMKHGRGCPFIFRHDSDRSFHVGLRACWRINSAEGRFRAVTVQLRYSAIHAPSFV